MHVRAVVAIGLAVIGLGLSVPVSAATTAAVSVTKLSTSASFGKSGPTSVACMKRGQLRRERVRIRRSGHGPNGARREVGTADRPTKKLGKIVNSILITTSCYASGCVAFGRYIKLQTSTKDEHFTVSYATGRWAKAIPLSLNLGSAKAFQEFKITCSDRRNCVVVGTLRYSNESASTPTYAPRCSPRRRDAGAPRDRSAPECPQWGG